MTTQRRTRTRQTRVEQQGLKFRISRDILRQILRLTPDVKIIGATYDPDTSLVEFELDVPHAPDGATELVVSYQHTGGRDPIHARSGFAFPDQSSVRSLPLDEEAG